MRASAAAKSSEREKEKAFRQFIALGNAFTLKLFFISLLVTEFKAKLSSNNCVVGGISDFDSFASYGINVASPFLRNFTIFRYEKSCHKQRIQFVSASQTFITHRHTHTQFPQNICVVPEASLTKTSEYLPFSSLSDEHK